MPELILKVSKPEPPVKLSLPPPPSIVSLPPPPTIVSDCILPSITKPYDACELALSEIPDDPTRAAKLTVPPLSCTLESVATFSVPSFELVELTVFEKDSPFQKFVRGKVNGADTAEGPGAADDKGGMVAMVAALRAMQAAGTLKNANIEIHMTGDEEDSGDPISIARRDLIAAGKRADVALDFEGLVRDGGRDMGSISRRSSNSWKVTATGKSGHSSGIFSASAGDGAIFELARIISRFRTELPEPNLTFNVGIITGGQDASLDADGVRATAKGKTNIIPGIAIARGDFRTLSNEQTARVRAKMAAIVKDHAPVTRAEIVFDEGYPPMAPTPGNKAVLDRLNKVNADLGLAEMPVLDPLKRGAGDISFVAADVDGIAGLGPYSWGDHAPGETVDLESVRTQAKRAAILMTRLASEKALKTR
ncbi:MAG: M20/M25/M40 family metallo-hydrolase [Sphingomonadaceae bacterium]|nr:M20/M25/M40 family metallo-hydrolase [Sphingomonadaceae bacterium]